MRTMRLPGASSAETNEDAETPQAIEAEESDCIDLVLRTGFSNRAAQEFIARRTRRRLAARRP